MKLVGLTGKAGSGKNEAANALVAAGWKQAAFADKMRKAVLALDPYIADDGNHFVRLSSIVSHEGWDEAKRSYPEVRRLLQRFGTEAGRDIHGEDCWVDALFRGFGGFGTISPSLVITDCRFDNEARAIHKRGGYVIEIVRSNLAPLSSGNSSHASEAGVSDHLIDCRIRNDSSVEELHERVLFQVEVLTQVGSRS